MKTLPECPHCGYRFDAEETWYSNHSELSAVSTGDCEESIVQCHNLDCKKKFKIYCEHVAMFISETIET